MTAESPRSDRRHRGGHETEDASRSSGSFPGRGERGSGHGEGFLITTIEIFPSPHACLGRRTRFDDQVRHITRPGPSSQFLGGHFRVESSIVYT